LGRRCAGCDQLDDRRALTLDRRQSLELTRGDELELTAAPSLHRHVGRGRGVERAHPASTATGVRSTPALWAASCWSAMVAHELRSWPRRLLTCSRCFGFCSSR